MQKDLEMSLDEIKSLYFSNKITRNKLRFALLEHKSTLMSMYPNTTDIMALGYLYFNNLSEDVSFCNRSNKAKRLVSMSNGFLSFCGNQSTCICNKENSTNKRELKTAKDKEQIQEKRKLTNIKKYGVDNPSKLESIKDKAANTCYSRYGTKSPTQSKEIFDKVKQSMKNRWGVEYCQQHQLLKNKAEDTWIKERGVSRPAKDKTVIKKMKDTMIKKYGVDHNMKIESIAHAARLARRAKQYSSIISVRSSAVPMFTIDEYSNGISGAEWDWQCNYCQSIFKQKIIPGKDCRCEKCRPLSESFGESEIKKWLQENNIDFLQNTRKIIKPYELDFYIPNLKIAIEFNGIWWHSDTILNDKKYHFNKFKMAKDLGIKLIQIWEHDLINKKEIIFSRLQYNFNKSNLKIGARLTKIKELSFEETKLFFDTYHLQGYRPAKYNYGLFYKDELVAAISISKSRFNKKYDYELIRYAVKTDISVSGGLTRLLSHAKNVLGHGTLVSYADLCWGYGYGYEASGFKFERYTNPSYFYFKTPFDVSSRFEFQKHKILHLSEGNSESEIALNLGYNKFYDAGNSVWITNL